MKRERILGIPYDNLSTEDAVSRVENFVRDSECHTIVHLSLPLLMKARRTRYIMRFLEGADLIIPTGKYIHWAARFLKRPLKEVIEPSLFVKRLMMQSAELGKKVYLFGGKGHTIDKAYNNIKREIGKLFVLGRYRGNYGKLEHDNVITAIGKASPDYFFIGLGSPEEEIWVIRNRKVINAGLIILIERLFDLFAGNIKNVSAYKKGLSIDRVSKREIPNPYLFKRLWMVPVFRVSVYIEKLFWKN